MTFGSPPIVIRRSLPTLGTTSTGYNERFRIYVAWAESVTEAQTQAVLDGIEEVLDLADFQRVIVPIGTRTFGRGNVDWYQQLALVDPERDYGYGSQIVSGNLIWGPYNETSNPFPRHFVVSITDHDMRSGSYGFVFGSANEGYGFVVSTARLVDLIITETKLTALQRLASHEMGHVLKAPSRNKVADGHCGSDSCLMNFCSSLGQVIEEEKRGVTFCSSCLNDLKRSASW